MKCVISGRCSEVQLLVRVVVLGLVLKLQITLFSRVTIIFINDACIGDLVFSISFLEFDVFQILAILVGI